MNQGVSFPSRSDIIAARRSCGLTQEDVAYEAGLCVRTVRSVETSGDPRASTLASVVRVLYEHRSELDDDEAAVFESWTGAHQKPN